MEYTWNYLYQGARPKENEVVNVIAHDYITGEKAQFLATYTSYKVIDKVKDVWTPLGGEFLFNQLTVSAWCYRLKPENEYKYRDWN